MKKLVLATLAGAVVTLHGEQQPPGAQQSQNPDSFRFKSGDEFINVTATVSDMSGRFVPNPRKEDFIVFEDDQPQTVTNFSADRLPVSLGVTLDTSASTADEKTKPAAP